MGFMSEIVKVKLTPEDFGNLLNGRDNLQVMHKVDNSGKIITVILSPLGEIIVGQKFTIDVSIEDPKKQEQE